MARVVLVTGSTSGIGEATALRFAALGDTVVFNSAHSVREGERLAEVTPGSHYVQADITKEDDCARLVLEVVARYGRLDVLINNAGATKKIAHSDLAAATVDVWRQIFEVNVFGTWSMCVAAMEELRKTNGVIVNVSSVAGVRPTGSSIPYASSKAALNHLTALLAKAVGPEVRVNAVAPGLIDTPWTADWELERKFVSAVAPLHRSGTPEDVSDVIVALAATPYVTGQVVVVDGGLSTAL
jgi:ketoreductase RED2